MLPFFNPRFDEYLLVHLFWPVWSVACFSQIYSVCELYFSFPTVILSKANFDVFEIPLPSITLCTDIGKRSYGKSSQEFFKTFNFSITIDWIRYYEQENNHDKIIFNPDQKIEILSMAYYCMTFKQS